jgi:hypothetical protein
MAEQRPTNLAAPDDTSRIVALSGRRIDAEKQHPSRFPFSRVSAVSNEIKMKLVTEQAETLVCSAACGADLLALEVAQALGIRTRIILPYSRADFRKTSVTDRPHQDFWGPLFDRVVAEAHKHGDVLELGCRKAEDASFLATNEAIIDEAQNLAEHNGGSVPTAILVWNGMPRGSSDVIQDFANRAKMAGFQMMEVITV